MNTNNEGSDLPPQDPKMRELVSALRYGYRHRRLVNPTSDAASLPALETAAMEQKVSTLNAKAAPAGSPPSDLVKSLPQGTRPDTALMEAFSELVSGCRACRLRATRNRAVPGTGSLTPRVMVIGDGPGADEDTTGLPFVGMAGQALDKQLEAIGLSRRENCYITNLVKCRPPANRDPQPDEVHGCIAFLNWQIDTLKPGALLLLGPTVLGAILGEPVRIGQRHGQFLEYRGVPAMATYHPSATLRDETLKRPVWEDLKSFKARFLQGIPPLKS